MVLSDEEDEESQLLLAKSSESLRSSKKTLIETRQIGEEVLRNLEADAEKIDFVRRKQDRIKGLVGKAESTARTIEQNALFQLAFVCLVLCAVIFGFLFVLVRVMLFK